MLSVRGMVDPAALEFVAKKHFSTRIPKLLAAILCNFLGINGFVEVRRIVKIRLASPHPFLLQALAQSHPL